MRTIRVPLLQILLLCVLSVSLPSHASDDFIAPEEYLNRVFAGKVPDSKTVWMSGEVKTTAMEILGHDPEFLRLRYWDNGQKTVWIINEIGKTEPITFGLVVSNAKIESTEVLAFRESRGWEIKHDFFRKQFIGAALGRAHGLDRHINGISGATLSVKAMTRVSRLVLYLTTTLAS